MDNIIYTIGHSNHSADAFVRLLTEAKIEVLVDVRSNPGSPWAPYANPHSLKQILKAAGIEYLYLGDELGGRSSDADTSDPQTGKVDYRAMQNKPRFKRGLVRLLEGLKKFRICVMCAEEDPYSCHRNLLIADSLRREGVQVLHIRGNGRIQTDEELWKEKTGVADNQLLLPL